MTEKALVALGAFLLCLTLLLVLWLRMHLSSTSPPDHPAAPVDLAATKAKADKGDARAQWQLGEIYSRGQAVAGSYKEAAKWYRLAAEQGNPDAEAALAELYQAGQGVSRDLQEASRLFRRAAAKGNIRAEYSLGFMYETGRGLPQDQVQAAYWYGLAAQHGEALAQYDLGQRYDLGVGLPVDKVEALKWLMLAAARGIPDAAQRAEQVKHALTRKEISEARHRVALFSTNKTVP